MKIPTIFKESTPQTIDEWQTKRRPEILNLFGVNVYGITPNVKPNVKFSVKKQEKGLYDGTVDLNIITAQFSKDNSHCSFDFSVYTPANIKGTLPAVIMINPFSIRPEFQDPIRNYNQLPADIITKAGYVAVHAHVDMICNDDAKTAYDGILSMIEPVPESSWGSIGAWAFATSRVIDYLVTCSYIDPSKIAVNGCSRAGKTALWCAAQDERISLILSNVSGCTGAAITRGKTGEHIKDITTNFPHWMCKRYAEYSDREDDLPLDQHMLLALCAPRPMYIASASDDEWADPHKEFESCKLASQIYDIYEKKGLCSNTFPGVNEPLMDGDLAYHLREGKHGCFVYDWENYIKFMDKYFK